MRTSGQGHLIVASSIGVVSNTAGTLMAWWVVPGLWKSRRCGLRKFEHLMPKPELDLKKKNFTGHFLGRRNSEALHSQFVFPAETLGENDWDGNISRF